MDELDLNKFISKDNIANFDDKAKQDIKNKIDDTKYIYSPLKDFNNIYKNKVNEEADKFFEDLVKKSKIDVNQNIADYDLYLKKLDELKIKKEELDKHKSAKNLRKTLSIISLVIGIILFVVALLNINGFLTFGIVGIILGVILIILGIIFLVLKNKKRDAAIIRLTKEIDKLNKEKDDLLVKCNIEMAPLNNLFSYHMFKKVFTLTIPSIRFDEYLDYKKFSFIKEKYGILDNQGSDESMISVLSGECYGSPFILYNTLYHNLGEKTYTGSIVVTYTVYNGKNSSTRSQTLVASLTLPCPYYSNRATLFLGNEAAPNLHFVRQNNPTIEKELSEKDLNRRIKDLEEKEEDALKEGKKLTLLTNKEFEVYFNTLSRDNETEFRLLFTPLAQQEMEDLIKFSPYGDDFIFIKDGIRNYVKSVHSQEFNYDVIPSSFASPSYKVSKMNFLNYAQNFFSSLYFDFAPLLTIPLYQQHKPLEYIYKDYYERNFSSYAIEPLLNKSSDKEFAPKNHTTPTILKYNFIKRYENYDIVDVYAFSYFGENKIAYIPKSANDGRIYDVPINYVEYHSLNRTRRVIIGNSLSGLRNLLKSKDIVESNEVLSNLFDIYSLEEVNSLYMIPLKGDLTKENDFTNLDYDKIINELNKLI